MKKILLWVVLSLSFSTLTFAQSNFKPGYVINLQNDTLKGYIDYKEWGLNPKTIRFKSSLNEKNPGEYSVGNASAFAITNLEYYKRAKVHVSKASADVQNLSIGLDTSYTVDTVFLKVLISGKNVSLYELSDHVKIHYYVEDNATGAVNELNNFQYADKYDNTIMRTVPVFRTQLKALAAKYPGNDKLAQKIETAGYTDNDLSPVIISINGDQNEHIEHSSLFGSRFFIGAAVSSNKLTFASDGADQTSGPFPYGAKASYTAPVLSGGMDFLFNKNTQKVIFRAELSVTQNHFYIPYTEVNVVGGQASLDFKQLNTTIIPQVIYNFYSKDDFKVFIDGGLAVNISFYNSYYYNTNYNNVSFTKAKGYPQFGSEWISVPLKLGVVVSKKLEVYGTYSPSSALNQYGVHSANLSSYRAGINYLFGN